MGPIQFMRRNKQNSDNILDTNQIYYVEPIRLKSLS